MSGEIERNRQTHTHIHREKERESMHTERKRGEGQEREPSHPKAAHLPHARVTSQPPRPYLHVVSHSSYTNTCSYTSHGRPRILASIPAGCRAAGMAGEQKQIYFFCCFVVEGTGAAFRLFFCQGRLCVLCFRFKCSCMFFSRGLELTFIDLYFILVLFHICIFPFFVCVLYLRYI